MSETLFSQIIKKEIPADIVHEDEETIAFKDINPKAPVHILICPKKPIPTLADMEKEDGPLLLHMHQVAQHLAEAMELEGWRLIVNVGEKGGQEVFHLHFHLLGWPKDQTK